MRKEKTEKYVGIRCPQCGHIQKARGRKTLPFYAYVCICKKCGYVTIESEWDEVKQPINK